MVTITPAKPNRANTSRLILAFERAVVEEAFSGSAPTEDRPAIRTKYIRARKRLLDYINSEG